MTKDLTDHVREKDEAEGPSMTHKPITDREAKELQEFCDKVERGKVGQGGSPLYDIAYVASQHLRGKATTIIPRLLEDRAVAMGMIECYERDCKVCYVIHETTFRCGNCDKARALLAAVRGEE
ncbi:hypothetical protein LCGC14_1742310 [marine sediment metagenome]|uniref:Uncharacterized protein n=1 Tax=marine sediment metagenome TaxID=412755 RepID=A0A0F9HTX5_9ZZZZ